jgi:hypothetical protein
MSLPNEKERTEHHELSSATVEAEAEKGLNTDIDNAFHQNAALDRSLNRKFDTHILPWLFVSS